ncbi:hypothetical protein [Nocardiopsis halophila]|uniref:hypothetical protein n=1 Tax=Nocardiopsis halophila TaxID=141692 RepID=UPI00034587DE|nr:hypothetical protein [Nocardiopsis halophila]
MAEDDASHVTNTVSENHGTAFLIGNVYGSVVLPRRGGRLAAVIAVVVLGVAVVHGIVLARYAEFYRALGVGLGEVPVGYGEFVAATAETTLLATAVLVVLIVGYATGAALVPSSPSPELAVPAAALATVVYAACLVASAYGAAYAALLPWLPAGAPDLAATLVVAVVGVGWLGTAARLISGESTYAYLLGVLVGAAAVAGAAAPAVALRAWLLPQPWPLLVFLAGSAALVLALRRWYRRKARADAADDAHDGGPEAPVRPRDLLTRLRHDLVPFSDPRDLESRVPGAQARRTAVVFLVASGLAGLIALAGYLVAVGSAIDAGMAVREYGYLPPERSALALPRTVRPVEVAPAGTDADPAGICAGPERAATLIGRSDGTAWLLLRPLEEDRAAPEVVPVSTTEYTVRLHPDTALGKDPWTRQVCGQ